jgi:hypothetical protein
VLFQVTSVFGLACLLLMTCVRTIAWLTKVATELLNAVTPTEPLEGLGGQMRAGTLRPPRPYSQEGLSSYDVWKMQRGSTGTARARLELSHQGVFSVGERGHRLTERRPPFLGEEQALAVKDANPRRFRK